MMLHGLDVVCVCASDCLLASLFVCLSTCLPTCLSPQHLPVCFLIYQPVCFCIVADVSVLQVFISESAAEEKKCSSGLERLYIHLSIVPQIVF